MIILSQNLNCDNELFRHLNKFCQERVNMDVLIALETTKDLLAYRSKHQISLHNEFNV